MTAGTRRRTTSRARLSRDRILRTAMKLADTEGLDALSMRRLAGELGVEAMSLYNHVADKGDLLEAIVDLAVTEIDLPAPGEDWRPAMRRRAISARDMLRRHPWASGLIEANPNPEPARLQYPERVLACLRESGFSVELAVHAFNLLDSFIYGFALQERTLPFQGPGEMEGVGDTILREADGAAIPYLTEVVVTLIRSGYDYANEFEFGLEFILDGLERHLEASRANAG